MMKYSLMIPVYNKVECLKKYLSTIINQNIIDYEVIIVDDFSTDGSYEYLKEIEKTCNKLKVYRNNKNMGIGYTRNKLISHSSGKYLIFVDPDDYVEENLLRELDRYYDLNLDVIRFQNVIEPVGATQILNEHGKNLYRYSCPPTGVINGEQALLEWFFGERKINTFPWTYAIKKEIYNGVKYPEVPFLEDLAIIPYLIAKSKKIKAIDFIGYHYLKYDSSLSTNSDDYAIYKLKILKQIIELAKLYISTTDISEQTKKLYYEDLENRYNIRKEKIYSKTK